MAYCNTATRAKLGQYWVRRSAVKGTIVATGRKSVNFNKVIQGLTFSSTSLESIG